jgi:virginiamycin B lyase
MQPKRFDTYNHYRLNPKILRALFLMMLATSACGGDNRGATSTTSAQDLAIGANLIPPLNSTPSISATAAPAKVVVDLTFFLPSSSTVEPISSVVTSARLRAQSRRPEYISTANTSITITVTPLGGSPTTFGPTPCTTSSCAITFTAAPGPNTLAFNLTDSSNIVLSTYSTLSIIQPSGLNTLNFTASGAVNSVALSPATLSLSTGTISDQALTLNALDADGRTIIAPGSYVDSSGNPVNFTLSVTNTQNDGVGTVTIQGPAVITGPNHATINAHYDGKALSSATISVTSSSSLVSILTGGVLSFSPSVIVEYTVPTSGSEPDGISFAPDGYFWFTEFNGNKIGRMALTGSINEYTVPTGGSVPADSIVVAPDGNEWFAERSGNKIARVTKAGVFTEFTIPTSGCTPIGMTVGPDGNLWFVESTAAKIGRLTLSGVFTEFSVPTSGSALTGITAGPDKNLWFTENSSSKVGRITPSGVVTEFTTPTGSSGPWGITVGPDNNIWVTERGIGKIARINLAGGITELPISISGAAPVGIITGPDGNMWFSDAGTNAIGKMTVAGAVSEVSVPTSGSAPDNFAIGPDGNLWFTEFSANKIGKLVI